MSRRSFFVIAHVRFGGGSGSSGTRRGTPSTASELNTSLQDGSEDRTGGGCELGSAADDLVNPFSPTELAARIRAALRKRLEPFQGEPSGPYDAGGLAIDYALRWVTVAGKPVELTATEYSVLYELAVHTPRTLTHSVLLQRVWGSERVGQTWLVRNVVKRLRRKLGDAADNPRYIFTEPRVGYRMAIEEPVGEQ